MRSRPRLVNAFRRWTAAFHPEDPGSRAAYPAILPGAAELRTLIEDVVSSAGVPGAALSVVVDGRAVNVATGVRSMDAYHPLHESALFEPLGLTKLAVAGVVHELARAGTLGLVDPIERWLPELAGRETGKDISIGHLLSHTSGYVGENPADLDNLFHYPWEGFAAYFRSTPQAHVPGTVFDLVESEYAVLGEVVRRSAGDEALDLAGEMLFERLPSTRCDDDPEAAGGTVPGHAFTPFEGGFSAIAGDRPCGFWAPSLLGPAMTTEQMARLAELVLVPPASPNCYPGLAKRVVRLPVQLRGARCAEVPQSFGLGWGEFVPGVIGLSSEGMGQCNAVRVLPERSISLAVVLNCQAPHVRDDIVAEILAMAGGVELSTPASRIELDRPAEQFEGVYRAAHWQTLQVSREGDGLRVTNGYNPWLPVEHTAAGAMLNILDPRICALAEGSEDWSLGFFPDPSTGRPCLMAGLSAFAKIE